MKVILEPGDYRVTWEFPDQEGRIHELDGEVELAADRMPRATVFGDIPTVWTDVEKGKSAAFPQIYEEKLVVGRLANGRHIGLVDVTVEVWLPERARLRARAALVGNTRPPGPGITVTGVEVQVEGLDSVAGSGPIKSLALPIPKPNGKRYLDWSWTATGNAESTQLWTDEKCEVELQFYNSFTSPNAFIFQVSFQPVILMTFHEPVPFDRTFTEWIEPLRRLISLSTGNRERLTFLALTVEGDQDGTHSFQIYGTALHQCPYSSQKPSHGQSKPTFHLAPEDMSLLALLRRWQELSAEHHPLLETYASLMYAPDQHPRSAFLLLLQALEGLHGFETREVFKARSEGLARRREVALTEAEEAGLSVETMKFLRQNVSKSPRTSLDEALQFVLSSVPVDVLPALEKSELIRQVMSDVRQPKRVVDCLRIVRNDLAHGTRGYDAEGLHDVVSLLDGVVRAHFLRILGCSSAAQLAAQEP
ncbi:MAG: hypothetical protein Q8M73_06225 [Actinomycetota bacterium]|nr:hypothetical protein [Actinomycetota bacterium]